MQDYKNKRVLIVGATGGIGSNLATRLAAQGAHLFLTGRKQATLENLSRVCVERGARVGHCIADLSDSDSCRALVDQALAELQGIDVLVLAAGIARHQLFEEITETSFKQVMDINFYSCVNCTRHALDALKQSRGQIVVVSSLWGKFASPTSTAYAASKHALHGFFNSLRQELQGHGVTITMICPAGVDTNIHKTYAQPKTVEKMMLMKVSTCSERILASMRKGKREPMMSWVGATAGLLYPVAPRLIDWLFTKAFKKIGLFQSSEPE